MKIEDAGNIISLSGSWSFMLDDHAIGEEEVWYQQVFAKDTDVMLPGTTTTNQIGESFDFDGSLNKINVQHLRQKNRYIGVAWYQREIFIPDNWENNQIILHLERVMFSSNVYINENFVGSNDSLSVAHEYNITKYVSIGKKNLLTIKIDNRDVKKIGTYPSAYTDETQTIWNGIVGSIQLMKKNLVDINKIKITPSIENKEVAIQVTIDNIYSPEGRAKLITNIREKDTTLVVASHQEELELEDYGDITIQYIVKINPDVVVKMWDEFEPNLYEVELVIERDGQYGIIFEPVIETFGFRELRTDGRQLVMNGHPLFLRGTLDCCVFPLTGYPTCDEKEWRRILSTVKAYGLNHVRYHSWCPPEACFKMADELGLYLQVEGPVWMDNWMNATVGCQEEHYEYLPAEAKRIIDAYGNHPSFCLFSNGNELNGDFTLLHNTIKMVKDDDKRFLCTLSTNWDRKIDEMDDIFITQSVDGVGIRGQYFLDEMAESTNLTYNQAVKRSKVPVISHEVGQYCVYPNMKEIEKYKGVLRPVNFEAIYKDLEKKDMLSDTEKFAQSSGKLALQLYKAEIEAALSTTSFGGFQLLGLHDFPGQSTATIGLLDSFWESKDLVTPEEFRGFCSETVCLLKMDKRIYSNKEGFIGKVQIANYGRYEQNQTICWNILDQDDSLLYEGDFKEINLSLGIINHIGEIRIGDFSGIKQAKQVTIKVWIKGRTIYNNWQIWIYPDEVTDGITDLVVNEDSIVIRSIWDEETKLLLEQGKKVLLVPLAKNLKHAYPSKFFPVFWSPVHFVSKDPCGIWCDNSHNIFNSFPTDYYSSYQWKELLENSISIGVDDLPRDVELLVQAIPNFYNNHRQAILFEANVGKGKLLVCSVDILADLDNKPMIKQFKRSILNYMGSNDFQPNTSLDLSILDTIFVIPKMGDNQLRKDLAFKKKANSDSKKSSVYGADKGNDGNSFSSWLAADADDGHYWEVDLGEIMPIQGTKVEFLSEANYLYVIQTSEDGIRYQLAVNQTGQTSTAKIREDLFEASARFVRIVYNGLPSGVCAGHISFEVF